MNGVASRAASAAGRVRQVVRVDAADDQRVDLLVERGGEDAGGVAAGRARAGRATPQARATSARAAASATGRPIGSRPGSAPASMAPRSPARRGTQASRAPVAATGGRRADSAPGTGASRSPTRMTAPSALSSSAAALPGASSPTPVIRLPSASASPPGAVVEQRAAELGQAAGGERRDREDLEARACAPPCGAAGRRSATPPPARSRRAAPRAPSPARRRRPSIGLPATGTREELGLLAGVRAGAEVDVVGAEGEPGELGVRVGVLERQPAAGQHAGLAARLRQALGGDAQRLRPGRGLQHAVLVTDQRVGEPVGLGGVGERPAALVAVPLLVDLRVVAGEAAGDLAAPVVGALRAAGGAVLADARRGDQVERAGPEAVRRAGQRADRADLHGVAGEVGLERLAVGATPTCSLAPRSNRSMKASPAISSENRVQRAHWMHRSRSSSTWLRQRDRLGEGALRLVRTATRRGRWTSPGSAAGTRRPCRRPGSPAGG